MTISKGSGYGGPASVPENAVPCDSDTAVRAVLERARRDRTANPPVLLRGGDLYRTLGGSAGGGGEAGASMGNAFPVDVGEALIDGRVHLFVAHLVARTPTWSYAVIAMNAQWLDAGWLGSWNVGHKAHPGDAILDVSEARLGVADRLKVRTRLPLGAHMPHPGIAERRVSAYQIELPSPLWIRLDGEKVTKGKDISLRLRPDALTVHL